MRGVTAFSEKCGASLVKYGIYYNAVQVVPNLPPIDNDIKKVLLETLECMYDVSGPAPKNELKAA